MFKQGLLSVGVAAAVANAFLIPSSISLPGLEISDAEPLDNPPRVHHEQGFPAEEDVHPIVEVEADPLPIYGEEQVDEPWHVSPLRFLENTMGSVVAEPIGRVSVLDCVGCEADVPDPDSVSAILLDWKLTSDRKALLLNGQEIFPVVKHDRPFYARQLRDGSDGGPSSKDVELSFVTALSSQPADNGEMHTLSFCLIQFSEVGQGFRPRGPNECDMVKMFEHDGLLHLADTSLDNTAAPFDHIHGSNGFKHTCPAGPSFASVMCRLRETIMSKARLGSSLFSHHTKGAKPEHGKDCPGRFRFHEDGIDVPMHYPKPPRIHGGPAKYQHLKDLNVDEVDQAPYHHYHHRHHFGHVLHKLADGIRSFVMGFLVPVAIGVLAGIFTSVLGLLVGSLIGYLWVKLVRGGKRGNTTAAQAAREARVVAAVDDDDVVVEEKEALLDHAPAFSELEAPPVYAEKE